MKKIDFVFVILHYLTIRDTVEAVESIKTVIKDYKVKIVIVDNGSNNGTGEILKKMYESDKQVFVIMSMVNLGYAKGNNLGIEYALDAFSPDFIVVSNNDVIFSQTDFIESIYQEFSESHFSVLGPMVITADGKKDSSPIRGTAVTRKSIVDTLRKEKILYFFELLHLGKLYGAFNRLYGNIRYELGVDKNDRLENNTLWNKKSEDVILHGCCLIFSPIFFEYFGGFYPKTFLYHEEEILYILATSSGLKMVYNPRICIFHKEDSASNEMMPIEHDRYLFKLKNCIFSSKLLLKVFDDNC